MPSSVLFILFFFTSFKSVKSRRWHPSPLAYIGNQTAILQWICIYGKSKAAPAVNHSLAPTH